MVQHKKNITNSNKRIIYLCIVFIYLFNTYNISFAFSGSIPSSSSTTKIDSFLSSGNTVSATGHSTALFSSTGYRQDYSSDMPVSELFLDTIPALSQIEGIFDFSIYLVDRELIPSSFKGSIPIMEDIDLLPQSQANTDYVGYMRTLSMGSTSLGSAIRTFITENGLPISQYVNIYRNRNGTETVFFLYKNFDGSYDYGSYILDPATEKLRIINVKRVLSNGGSYFFSAQFDYPDRVDGYDLKYQISSGQNRYESNIQVREYNFLDGEDKKTSFNTYVIENGNRVKGTYVELDRYDQNLGIYLGQYVTKIGGITSIEDIETSYSIAIPEQNAFIKISYQALANPDDPSNPFNSPDITYTKMTDSGLMNLNFKSPIPISKVDLRNRNLVDNLIKALQANIGSTSLSLTQYLINGSEEKVYTLQSVHGKSQIQYYNQHNNHEYQEIYDVNANINNFLTPFLSGNGTLLQGQFEPLMTADRLRGYTEYAQGIDPGRTDGIYIERRTFAAKENGDREWQISRLGIERNADVIAGIGSQGLAGVFAGQQGMEEALYSKSDFYIKVDSSGRVISAGGYARQKEGISGVDENWTGDYATYIAQLSALKQFTNEFGGGSVAVPVGLSNPSASAVLVGRFYEGNKIIEVVPWEGRHVRGERLANIGFQQLFFMNEYDLSGQLIRVGAGFIGREGKLLEPRFYINGSGDSYFIEEPLIYRAQLLYALLQHTGQLSEFERSGAVTVNLMQDLYAMWREIAGGDSRAEGSLMAQIEKAWTGYVELLRQEGLRAGFEVSEQGSGVINIIKGPDALTNKQLTIQKSDGVFWGEQRSRIDITHLGDGVPLKRSVLLLRSGETTGRNMLNFIAQYYAGHMLGGGVDVTLRVEHEFLYDSLDRLRKYTYYDSTAYPFEVFLPYIDLRSFAFEGFDPGTKTKDQMLRMEGILLSRELSSSPLIIKHQSDLREAFGGPLSPQSQTSLFYGISMPFASGSNWSDYIKNIISDSGYKVIYNGAELTDIEDVANILHGDIEIYGGFTGQTQPMSLHFNRGNLTSVDLYGFGKAVSIYPNMVQVTLGEGRADSYIYQFEASAPLGSSGSLYNFVSNLGTQLLKLTAFFDSNSVAQKGIDITIVVPGRGIAGTELYTAPENTVFAKVSGSFIDMVNTFKQLYGIVMATDQIEGLVDYFPDLKTDLWQGFASGALGLFSNIGSAIMEFSGLVSGANNPDGGVLWRTPITSVRMRHSNIELETSGPNAGASSLGFTHDDNSPQINSKTFQTLEQFSSWVKPLLGDAVSDSDIKQLYAQAYKPFVIDENKPWLFYYFLRGREGWEELKDSPTRWAEFAGLPYRLTIRFEQLLGLTTQEEQRIHGKQIPYKIYKDIYRQLTFPQPGDSWFARDGQLVFEEREFTLKISHVVATTGLLASYILPPLLSPLIAKIVSAAAGWGLNVAQAAGWSARVASAVEAITRYGTGFLLNLPIAALNSFRIAAQFIPFTAVMMHHQGLSPLDFFNQLGDQVINNAMYSFLFGMVFNPSLLGVELGVGPMVEKIFASGGKALQRLGARFSNSSSFLLSGLSDPITIIGKGVAGLSHVFGYGDAITKSWIGTRPGTEVAHTSLLHNFRRYASYLYVTESMIEEGLIPNIIEWQLGAGIDPERTHLGSSRKTVATLARAYMLCTETSGNIAEATDFLESPFSIALLGPASGMFSDLWKNGELGRFLFDLIRLKF